MDTNTFRDYTRSDAVREHYRKLRENQNPAYVKRMRKKYSRSATVPLYWKELLDMLSSYVDVSDPDVTIPNESHLYQTAEGIRNDGKPEWMQVAGFIHDIGKCIYVRGCDEDGTSILEQWGCVGDSFITGHPLPKSAILQEFNHTSQESIYEHGCGLKNCLVSWGHDEYLYNLVKSYDLPEEALYIIRYHSLYPWHSGGAYTELEDENDREMKPIVREFNKYDLYTKRNTPYTKKEIEELRTYYCNLVSKFLPDTIRL